eukprot:7004114-Lingulodinium_polyedra.AAC.1
MGIDVRFGCCQLEVGKRFTAEEVAKHPFIPSCRKLSEDMEMISDLAPLLHHMAPGDVRGHGSHEWIMPTLPV